MKRRRKAAKKYARLAAAHAGGPPGPAKDALWERVQKAYENSVKWREAYEAAREAEKSAGRGGALPSDSDNEEILRLPAPTRIFAEEPLEPKESTSALRRAAGDLLQKASSLETESSGRRDGVFLFRDPPAAYLRAADALKRR